MDIKLLRLACAIEFLIALIAVFTLWSQVGGQSHLDLMPWYWKLLVGMVAAFTSVRATMAAVESPKGWNRRTLRWLILLAASLAAAGILSYYYHLSEPADEEEQTLTANRNFPGGA
jgi:hypothetical protein